MDTGVIVAAWSSKDAHHREGVELLRDLQSGKLGRPILTDYILAETLNYFVAKARDQNLAENMARELLGEDETPWLQFVRVDDFVWKHARERFRVFSRAGLSFTDCTSISVIELAEFDGIVSFDSGFDGILKRFAGGRKVT